MKCLILAAGYATRLYPLTKNFPKPLLEDIDKRGVVDQYVVISNHKFTHHFQDWADKHTLPIAVLDDGTTTNEGRLGAVRDVQFAVDTLQLNDDLLVIAGDNLLDFSLTSFISYFQEKETTCIMRYWEESEAKLHKTGVAVVDEDDKIIDMEEKPEHPKSHWCTPPFYIYKSSDVGLVKVGIESGCGTDAPGSFIAWLSTQTPVHAYQMPGKRYDIGNLASYEEVQKNYKGITN